VATGHAADDESLAFAALLERLRQLDDPSLTEAEIAVRSGS
jgi:hypothetical protein